MKSIRIGERFIQDKMLAPWYGCQNMECDKQPITGSSGYGETNYYHVSKDQMKLWEHRCYVTLDVDDTNGTVCKKRAYDAKRAESILGRKLKIKVV